VSRGAPRGWPYDAPVRRLTVLISLTVMLDLAMWSAVLPLLPRYADDLDLSKLESGVLVAAYSAAIVIFSIPVGHWSDRLGTKAFTISGCLLMAAATAVFAFEPGFWLLLSARFAQGLSSAVSWSSGLAWLSASAQPERRGRVISIANSAATGGAICGPLIGGPLVEAVGLAWAFGCISAVWVGLATWAALTPAVAQPEATRRELRPAIAAARREPLIAVALASIMLVAGVGAVVQTLSTLDLDAGGVGQDTIGLLLSAGAVLGVIAILITGRIGDRRGRPPVAFWDCLVLGVAVAAFALPMRPELLGLLLVGFWPVQSVLYGIAYPLSTDGADRAEVGHGLVLGLLNLVWGLGSVIGPVLGGALADLAGDELSYLVASAAAFAVALAIRRVMVPGVPAPAPGPGSPSGR
jgi:MFS family permease